MKRVICTICLLLLFVSSCTAPTVETWAGFQIAEDIPMDVSKPKLGKLPQAKIHWYESIVYRTIYWPLGIVHR